MDKNEEREQEVKDARKEHRTSGKIILPVAQEYADVLLGIMDSMEQYEASLLLELKRDAKGIFSNKKLLSYITNLTMISHEMAKVSIMSYFAGDYLSRKQEVLEKAVLKILDKTNDLPTASDVRRLKKMSKQMTNMDAIMQKINDQITKRPTDKKTETKTQEESEKKNPDEATRRYVS